MKHHVVIFSISLLFFSDGSSVPEDSSGPEDSAGTAAGSEFDVTMKVKSFIKTDE